LRRPLLTLKGKMSLLFSLLGLLLVVTATLTALQLHAIEVDASRLVEETRESVLSSQLRSTIHDIEIQVKRHPDGFAPDTTDLETLRGSLGTFRRCLLEFRSGSEGRDPSRSEHQAAEDRVVDRILQDVGAIEASLHKAPSDERWVSAELDHALRYAQVLSRETQDEAGLDNSDLNRRAEGARWMLWIAFAVVVAAFVWISFYFIRRVATPILELRDGAERFGRGDLDHRFTMPRRDEIGELAASFNEMAARVGATHEGLEESLAERTREFIRAARFADLGVLAAGLAHEINNPLASIASSAEGLERRMDRGEVDPAEASEYLRTIASEAYRAKGITERLLLLARPDVAKQGLVDLKLVLSHLEIMFRHQIEKRGLRLRLEGCEGAPWIHGNSASFVQVFSNLLRNAEDASPPEGEILVRCVGTAADFRVEVLDRGPGIPLAMREKIFDPFYTTKDPGKGTGLGLVVASSLLEAMGGRIEVEAREGGGSRFVVHLLTELGVHLLTELGVHPLTENEAAR